MTSYSEGFKIGYSANAPLAGISEGIKMFTQEYRKQQEIGRQRQEEYDKARSEFKIKQEETYGKYAKEDLYDNTGITDFDALGDKFTKSALETYEINEFAFRNGFIDESQLTARNNNIKAQSQKLTKLYDEASTFLEEKKKLDDEGKSNPLNEMKLDILEDFSKQVKVSSSLDGLYLSTIGKDGKQRNISVSEFNKILNSESGVDLNSTYEDLLSNQGFSQTLSSGKKITSFITEEGDDMTALDAQILTMTDGQQLGALLSVTDESGNKLATSDKKEAKEKGIIYVGADRIIDPSITKEEQTALKKGMISQLRAMQERKQKTEIYNDPYRVKKTASQTVKDDTMRAAYEIAEKIGEGGEDANRLIDQVVANNDSIENMFFNKEKKSWVIEKIDEKGRRSAQIIKAPVLEDGTIDTRNLGVSLMSAISPNYSVEQAELAARDFEKNNPDYQFSKTTELFDRGYVPLPKLDSIVDDSKQNLGTFVENLDSDDVIKSLPKILSELGIDKGYSLEEVGGGLIKTAYGYGVKVIIPGYKSENGLNFILLRPKIDTGEQLKEKIRFIGDSIKSSGGLIQGSSSGTTSATGKKKLPTG